MHQRGDEERQKRGWVGSMNFTPEKKSANRFEVIVCKKKKTMALEQPNKSCIVSKKEPTVSNLNLLNSKSNQRQRRSRSRSPLSHRNRSRSRNTSVSEEEDDEEEGEDELVDDEKKKKDKEKKEMLSLLEINLQCEKAKVQWKEFTAALQQCKWMDTYYQRHYGPVGQAYPVMIQKVQDAVGPSMRYYMFHQMGNDHRQCFHCNNKAFPWQWVECERQCARCFCCMGCATKCIC